MTARMVLQITTSPKMGARHSQLGKNSWTIGGKSGAF
jgi:hypothetical protein